MSLSNHPNVLGGLSSAGGGGSGTPGGANTQVQFNNNGAFDGNSTFTFNDSTGVLTLGGSMTRTPATITINEGSPDTGTIDITKGYSQATIDEATTLTPSAAGSNGQYIILDIINSGGSAYVITVDTASDFTFTAAASGTTTVLIRSNGSGWVLVGGSPNIVDLSAAPAGVIYQQQVVNSSTGTPYKISAAAAQLGTHASPDTTGGAITWAAEVYQVWTNTTTEYDLPAAAGYAGKAVIFYVTGTNAITIDPNGSEVIVRAGTVQTGGVTMTLTGVAGNYVALFCDGVRWVTLGYSGTLAAGS